MAVYGLGASTKGAEVAKPRLSPGGAHIPAGRPKGPRHYVFTKHLSAPYSGIGPQVQGQNMNFIM